MPHVPRRIGNKIARIHRSLHRAGALNSEEIILRWAELQVPEGYIPDLETSPQPTSVEMSKSEMAFVHYVDIHTTGYTRFTQIRKGDIILDFPGDVQIDGKAQLRFEIGGSIYTQKDGGDELAKSWDVRCNGVAVTRTVLVTPVS